MKKLFYVLSAAIVIFLGLSAQSTAATCPEVAGTYEVKYQRKFKAKGLGTEKWKGTDQLILNDDGTWIFGDATGTYSCDKKGKKIKLKLDESGLDQMEDHFAEIISDLAFEKGTDLEPWEITCVIKKANISKIKINKKTEKAKGKIELSIKGKASAEVDGKQKKHKFTFQGNSVIVPNLPPTATITSPSNDAVFTVGQEIAFEGKGTDPEDGELTGNYLVWVSDKDGQIGTGQSFSLSTLSENTHTVALTVTDYDGAVDTDSIRITVNNFSSQWAIRYGGLFYESSSRSIQQTSDGGYIVAGETSFGAGNLPDMWVLKLNTDGSLNWQKSYGGGSDDSALSIHQTADNGYIMAGWGLGYSCWVLKLNSNGSSVWQKRYSQISSKFIIQTLNKQKKPNGYMMIGGNDLLRLSLNGSAIWQKEYGGGGFNFIQQTIDQNGSPDGYVIVGGWDYSIWVLRLNLDGSVVWQKAYNTGSDYGRSIQQTFGQKGKPTGFIVGGQTDFFDVWVLKLKTDGSVTWQMACGGNLRDELYDIRQTRDGGYIIAGDTWSFGSGSADAWLLKLSSNGTIEWQKTYGGSGYDSARSVQQLQDGGYIVTGETRSFGTPNSDVWVLKLNSNGEIPGCSAMGNSDTFGYETSAAIIDTNTVPREIQPSTTDIVVLPQDTMAETTNICTFP